MSSRIITGLACGLLLLAAGTASSRRIAPTTQLKPQIPTGTPVSLDIAPQDAPLRATAAASTTWLASYTFDQGGNCIDEGWTAVDLTAQAGTYWHVEDFVGMGSNYQGHVGALSASQSLWLGARPATTSPLCGYAVLPGYGNSWDQRFETTACVNTGPGAVVEFMIDWDSEPGYDATTLEMTSCTGAVSDENWIVLGGGIDDWDGNLDDISTTGDTLISIAIPDSLHGVSGENALKVRLRFVSDGAWSDEDGLWDTDGVAVDDLSLTGLPLEDFESESVGDTQTLSGNWAAVVAPGYGDFSGLFPGVAVLQEYPCSSNISCLWAFYNGSTADYSCGGHPEQATVPYQNTRGQYINNEIWSPEIPITGSGVQFEYAFDIYRDLPLNPLIFYVWHVRSIDASGCPRGWVDRAFVYYGGQRDWTRNLWWVGDLIHPEAVSLQLALGAVDMCQYWCGVYGTGECHTHAPLFDNVALYRIDNQGPQWSVRDIDLFQDTFAADGTLTGTARIDAAIDILPAQNPNIRPGDSTVVAVSDPQNGLAADPYTGFGAAVYTWVAVWGPSAAGLTGNDLTTDTFRWPFVDTATDGAGNTWYALRMDTSFTRGADRSGPQPDRFCIDLNDSLFVPGDTICFVFSATSAGGGATTWWTPFTGATADQAAAFTNPAECTILPAGGYNRGGEVLYVDGMNARGAQPFFDTAYQQLGIFEQVDRYDIRGPSSGVGNRPGSRVVDAFQQLVDVYQMIIWNTGDLNIGLIGDGTTTGEKSNDALMLLTFLDNLSLPGGVYFSGDNIAQEWPTWLGSAIPLRDTYIQHTLVNGSHVDQGFAISPRVIGEPNGAFDHLAGPDTMIAFGGCPRINDFDVLAPTSASNQEMFYDGGTTGTNGAVLSQYTLNPNNETVGVVLSGFSFHYIRDDVAGSGLDRSEHLRDISIFLDHITPEPTGIDPELATYRLSRNYPNPFNPTTAIEFTVREITPVIVTIYNVRGQRVKTLANDRFAPGRVHRLTWDGRNDAGQRVSSGVYFYRMVAKDFVQTRKMVLLK